MGCRLRFCKCVQSRKRQSPSGKERPLCPLLCPPGPQGRFLSGNLSAFVDRRLDFLAECAQKYGDFCAFRFGTRRVFLINHPDLIEQVLVTDARHYVKHFGAALQAGARQWPADQRGRLLAAAAPPAQPAFLRQRLVGYAPTMVALTEKMLADDWRDGQPVDVHHELSRLTSAIALKTLFGLDAGVERDAYTTSLREAFHLLSARFHTMLKVPTWLPTPNNRRLQRAIGRLRGLVDGFIQQARARKQPATICCPTFSLHATRTACA